MRDGSVSEEVRGGRIDLAARPGVAGGLATVAYKGGKQDGEVKEIAHGPMSMIVMKARGCRGVRSGGGGTVC